MCCNCMTHTFRFDLLALVEKQWWPPEKKTLERLGLVWGIPNIPMTRLEITLTSTDGNGVCTPDKVLSCLIFPPHLIFALTCDGGRTGVVITMLHMSKQTWVDEVHMWGVCCYNQHSSAWTLWKWLRETCFSHHLTLQSHRPQPPEEATLLG